MDIDQVAAKAQLEQEVCSVRGETEEAEVTAVDGPMDP